MRKLKLWQKIVIITGIVIISIILLITPTINYFLKRQISKTLNNSLNADVDIGKVRVNFLKSRIFIYDFTIRENLTPNNDTLLFSKIAGIDLAEYNKSENYINIENIIFKDFVFNQIIDDQGNDLWKYALENVQITTDIERQRKELPEFRLFIENIEISNAFISKKNHYSQSYQSISNIHIAIESKIYEDTVKSTYYGNANLSFENNTINENRHIELYGISDFSMQNKYFYTSFDFVFNGLNFNNCIEINFDKNSIKNSYYNISLDENKNPNFNFDGSLGMNITAQGFFDTLPNQNISVEFFADNLNLFSDDNEIFLSSNYNVWFNYIQDESPKFTISSENIFIKLNEDIIEGKLFASISDTMLYADNDMKGEINLNYFNDFLPESLKIKSGKMAMNSNLKGYIDNSNNLLTGAGIFDISHFKLAYYDYNYNLDNLSIYLDKSEMGLNVDFFSDSMTLKLDVIATELIGFYSDKDLNVQSEIYINKFNMPEISDQRLMIDRDRDIDFNLFIEKNTYKFIVSIDSIVEKNNPLRNFNIDLFVSPEKFELNNLFFEFNQGEIQASFISQKYKDYDVNDIKLFIKDLNLEQFKDEQNQLQGIVNISSENTIFVYHDKSYHTNKSKGFTEFYLNNFNIFNDIGSRFELDENIFIDSLGIKVDVLGDIVKIRPFSSKVNETTISSGAEINTYENNISSVSLIKIPYTSLSARSRLLITAMATSKTVSNKLDEDYINLLLEVKGDLSDPEYELYRLKN